MKKLFFAAILATISIAPIAWAEAEGVETNEEHGEQIEGITRSVVMGKIGCEREVWLKDAIRFHEERNEAGMKRYLKTHRCYALRDPSMIIVRQKLTADYYWVQAVINGKKLWVEVDGVTSEPNADARSGEKL
ncbi:hypothetical protein AGMMS50229_17680 [Campylobacterota bacterium]|nr:hypothetical protein AGMMS50229_17680 [Campylobacterota bacterium]